MSEGIAGNAREGGGTTDETRAGDWIQTFSGRAFWPLDPRAEDLHIVDIAHALSMICRYTGHCRHFYSVAQHSVLVARACSPEHRLWGLMHDASEAYICDVARPVKRHLAGYPEAEAALMAVVAQRYGLPPEMPAAVKRIDDAILADEMAVLMGQPARPWALREAPLGIAIEQWSPERAKHEFLEAYLTYSGAA